MNLRLRSVSERLRANLFFVPLVTVVFSIVLALGLLALDQRLDAGNARLPFGMTSTVDSARSLLSTIASATMAFAGIAFSVSLLTIQLRVERVLATASCTPCSGTRSTAG